MAIHFDSRRAGGAFQANELRDLVGCHLRRSRRATRRCPRAERRCSLSESHPPVVLLFSCCFSLLLLFFRLRAVAAGAVAADRLSRFLLQPRTPISEEKVRRRRRMRREMPMQNCVACEEGDLSSGPVIRLAASRNAFRAAACTRLVAGFEVTQERWSAARRTAASIKPEHREFCRPPAKLSAASWRVSGGGASPGEPL